MKYVLYLLLIAVIFGLVALVDLACRKLFPKAEIRKTGQAVKMPRISSIFGVILTAFGFLALLFIPMKDHLLLLIGCIVVVLMGVYLLVNYFRFGIWYDKEKFVYRTLTKKEKTYFYKDIRGQRAFLARSGFNTTLYVGEDEIPLYCAMEGLGEFLDKAFYRWCQETGTDPESVENNPGGWVFFPEP